jgi:hypothetical protein
MADPAAVPCLHPSLIRVNRDPGDVHAAAVPSQNFIRSRNLGSLPTQMRARNKIEI